MKDMKLMQRIAIRGLAIVTAAVLAAGSAAAQEDKLRMKDGTEKPGVVQDYDFKVIKLGTAGGRGSTNVKVEDVLSVEYAGIPKDFKEAEAAVQTQNDEAAVAKFQAVIDNKKLRSVFRQDAYFQAAAACFRLGKVDEGVKTLKDMLADAEFPLSRHLEAAQAQIVAGLTALSKADEAIAYIDAETARLQKVSDTQIISDRLRLLRCKTLMAKGDEKTAMADAQTLAGSSSPCAAEAKVVLGELALKAKNVADAEKHFREALRGSNMAKTARAACHNGLGAILLEKGEATKKPDTIKEALLAYLKTACTLMPAAGEPSENHEIALYKSAICYKDMAELDKAGDAQTRCFARAKDLLRRLLRDYPQTRLAADAKQLLERLPG